MEGPLARFAVELRDLREECGRPTYRQLATWSARVGFPYSDTTFSTAARGHTPPSRDVVVAFVRSCLAYAKTEEPDVDRLVGEWNARWEAMRTELAGSDAPLPQQSVESTAPPPAAPLTPAADQPRTEVDGDHSPEPQPTPPATARTLSSRRRLTLTLGIALTICCGLVLATHHIADPGSASADGTTTAAPSAETTPTSLTPALAGLGGNNRCGRQRHVDNLVWAPCTRVDDDTLVFAVQLINTGPEPVTVKAKLAYVRAGATQACPGAWGAGRKLTVAPGKTVTSPLTECAIPKLPTTAFQTESWVITPDAPTWGYREMSPTVHVQPDGRTTLWGDEA